MADIFKNTVLYVYRRVKERQKKERRCTTNDLRNLTHFSLSLTITYEFIVDHEKLDGTFIKALYFLFLKINELLMTMNDNKDTKRG